MFLDFAICFGRKGDSEHMMILMFVLFFYVGGLIILGSYLMWGTNIWIMDGLLIGGFINVRYGDKLPRLVESDTLNGVIWMALLLAVLGFSYKKVKAVAIVVGVTFTGLVAYQMYIECGLSWMTVIFTLVFAILHVRAYYGETLWEDVFDKVTGWLNNHFKFWWIFQFIGDCYLEFTGTNVFIPHPIRTLENVGYMWNKYAKVSALVMTIICAVEWIAYWVTGTMSTDIPVYGFMQRIVLILLLSAAVYLSNRSGIFDTFITVAVLFIPQARVVEYLLTHFTKMRNAQPGLAFVWGIASLIIIVFFSIGGRLVRTGVIELEKAEKKRMLGLYK